MMQGSSAIQNSEAKYASKFQSNKLNVSLFTKALANTFNHSCQIKGVITLINKSQLISSHVDCNKSDSHLRWHYSFLIFLLVSIYLKLAITIN
jgi:hypothetical protein